MKKKDVVLSGIRATGSLHLGNYFGVMRNYAKLSHDDTKQCYYFVANLHTLTTKTDPEDIKRDLIEIVMYYIAAGVDPEKAAIFAQSSVPETCELTWLLNCMTPIADLERMQHFKDKKDKKEALREMVNSGLLTYPVLMAADILGIQANLVPVGEDQYAHVELTKELVRRFNTIYGEMFTIPEILSGDAVRVPGLDGTGKAGKSEGNTINLSDPPKIVREKFRNAFSDPARERKSDQGDPSKCSVYAFHGIASPSEDLQKVYGGCMKAKIGCIECKEIISKHIIDILTPIQERKVELVRRGSSYILEILAEGGRQARKVVSKTVAEAKDRMGVPFY